MFTARSATLAAAASLALAAVAAHGQGAAAPVAPAVAPQPAAAPAPGDAKAISILNTTCVGCHDLSMLTARPHQRNEWGGILQQMVANGASVSDEDLKVLEAYLAKTYSAG